MEMQTDGKRGFTNQLPKWAIVAHIVLISFLFLLGVGLLYISIKEWIMDGMGLSIFLLVLSFIPLGLSWFSYRNLKIYLDFIVKINLTDQGYHYYFKDKKNNHEEYVLLPYGKINYVLIGVDYQTTYRKIPGREVPKTISLRLAKLMIYGLSSNNEQKVVCFSHGEQASLDEWLKVFQEHHVAIFQTDKALTSIPNTPEAVEQVPKEVFEGKLPFVIGSESKDTNNVFMTKEQKQLEEIQIRKRQKKSIIFITILSLLQIIIICFWSPYWDIIGKEFSDYNGNFFAIVFTYLYLLLMYLYIKRVKWYFPIRDAVILAVGILIGSFLSTDPRHSFHIAVIKYLYIICGWFLFVYYAIKLYKWFQAKQKKIKKKEDGAGF
ncbi:hypothetical protein H5P36_23030 [Bacillus sp. APMAM]|nr:hypothetical protein [Bacillus sp. APMAM]RTZ53540.1 hypothetical protein EKO25_22805 [Bacillus sp. SAJ1]